MSMRKTLGQEPTGTMYEEQERQKTLRLNREMKETPEPRLEWVYTGDRTKSEDYLLGKKYDANAATNPAPPEDSIGTSTIDLANKIREDPLYLIKKKEIEQKKKILENPVRLKQLKELLERQESAQSSSSRRKKHHSRSRSRSRSPQRRHRRSPSPHRHRRRSPSPPHRRRVSPTHGRRGTSPHATKRSDKPSKEDRERRIREMLVDGAVRTAQRQQNVRSFKERADQEDKVNDLLKQRARKQNDLSSSDDEEQDFLRPMMKQVVDDPSLKRRDLKHHYHKRR